MSFLDNPKSAGTALWIVGALEIILAIVTIVCFFLVKDVHEQFEKYNNGFIKVFVSALCAIIVGAIYFGLGQRIRGGEINDKWGIVTNYVLAVATASAVIAIFSIINTDPNAEKLFGWESVAAMIIGLIIAGIIFFVYKKMTDGKQTTIDKIFWVLLIVAFFLGVVGGILTIIGGVADLKGSTIIVGLIKGIISIVLYGFMLVAMFDPETKQNMLGHA